TELLGLTIENGTATVDFNEEFGNTELGATYDGIQIDQVTWTLTQFPSVKRVRYLIEGEVPEDGIGGHGILVDKPMTRKNSEHWLPPIVVEAPLPDQTVGRTFELSGIANVYEATVSWRLTGLDGEPFKRGFVTATCGTGCWGKFKDRISLERVPGEAIILEVFQSSAEDGSQLDLLKIPLNVQTAGP
ncbi:MAG: GerMN domain-containing protein, partial [Actinobacteria bacterium]|nr:GerMN domain-containing protein [Actinomycetota bacterium]